MKIIKEKENEAFLISRLIHIGIVCRLLFRHTHADKFSVFSERCLTTMLLLVLYLFFLIWCRIFFSATRHVVTSVLWAHELKFKYCNMCVLHFAEFAFAFVSCRMCVCVCIWGGWQRKYWVKKKQYYIIFLLKIVFVYAWKCVWILCVCCDKSEEGGPDLLWEEKVTIWDARDL